MRPQLKVWIECEDGRVALSEWRVALLEAIDEHGSLVAAARALGVLALCAVPDDRQVIREVARVLRADGRVVWLEHVRGPVAPVRWVQRLLDPLLVRLEADHLLRDPLDLIERERFIVERLERSRLGLYRARRRA